MQIGLLDASAESALRAVRFAESAPTWERDVEEGVCRLLADELRKGTNRSLGGWVENELASIVAWKTYGPGWNVTLLAVDARYRGHGRGAAMMHAVMDAAREEGIGLLFWTVHRENYAMQHVGANLGAEYEVDPNSIDYLLYVLKLAVL